MGSSTDSEFSRPLLQSSMYPFRSGTVTKSSHHTCASRGVAESCTPVDASEDINLHALCFSASANQNTCFLKQLVWELGRCLDEHLTASFKDDADRLAGKVILGSALVCTSEVRTYDHRDKKDRSLLSASYVNALQRTFENDQFLLHY